MTTQEMTNETMTIAQQLVDLCREGKSREAIDTLYADDIVSVEVSSMPEVGMPAEMSGIDAIRGKNAWWYDNHEVHGGECIGPFPHGDRFIVVYKYDVTCNMEGPMQGQRMQMAEAGLYTVADGKIVKEEFFYHMPG